jgi:hypothetical protein
MEHEYFMLKKRRRTSSSTGAKAEKSNPSIDTPKILELHFSHFANAMYELMVSRALAYIQRQG